jgi:hypothetical protein
MNAREVAKDVDAFRLLATRRYGSKALRQQLIPQRRHQEVLPDDGGAVGVVEDDHLVAARR